LTPPLRPDLLDDVRAGRVPLDFVMQGAPTASVRILFPLTDAAKAWVAAYLPADAITFAGGVAIEARFVSDIIEGITDAGLLVFVSLKAEVAH
jgi:hypothetical protein